MNVFVRSAAEIMQIRSIVTVADQLALLAPGLVVARGSTAVLAHAPALARVPNDLDVFWLGPDTAVPELITALSDDPRLRVFTTKDVATQDRRVSLLHRIDVLVWLSDDPPPSHRFWVDISTSRQTEPTETIPVAATSFFTVPTKVVVLSDVLAEKLFVYVESTQRMRTVMRWSDLFDMLVLILAAPALTQLPLGDVQLAVQRHFSRRAIEPPRTLPPPPRIWRSAWYRLVGPIAQIAPDINRASIAAAAFWNPVLREGGAPVDASWDVKGWRWVSGDMSSERSR